MTGTLVQKENKWVVKYDRGHDIVFYNLNPISEDWSKKDSVKKFINEGIEVDFSIITSGEYNEKIQSLVKDYYAKILSINPESI